MIDPDTLALEVSLQRVDFALNVALTLPAKGISVLFGPSGSGKTSLLRCVAGLEPQSRGRIAWGASVLSDSRQGIHSPSWQRPFAYVFQEASLFEHLDVMGNLSFGLKPERLHNKRCMVPQSAPLLSPELALEQAIEILGLEALLGRQPQQLSGGERQRVAMARALVTQPSLLMLDEPLASLDRARQQEVLPWLEKLRDTLHLPMLYVTHSETEMTRLASTLVLMDQGRVKACGPVQEIFTNAEWLTDLGEEPSSLIHAQVEERDEPWGLAQAKFKGGEFWCRDPGLAVGSCVRLRILARDVSIACRVPVGSSIQNIVPARIHSIQADRHFSQSLVRLDMEGTLLWAKVTSRSVAKLGLEVGQPVWAQVKSVALIE